MTKKKITAKPKTVENGDPVPAKVAKITPQKEVSSIKESLPIPRDQLESAVEALLKVIKTREKSSSLLGNSSKILLTISLHRILSKKRKNIFIKLPNPIYTTASEICVFTKDAGPNSIEKATQEFEDLFREKVGFVPKIITFESLRKDYKQYEAQRALCGSYDLFLSDDRVTRLVCRQLSKVFYSKKKKPWDIRLSAKNLNKQFTKLLALTQWNISGNGDNGIVHFASSSFTVSQICDNLEQVILAIVNKLPRGWANVRGLRLRTDDSIAIPFYLNNEEATDIDLKDAEEVEYVEKNKKRKSQGGFLRPKKTLKVSKKRKRPKRETKKETTAAVAAVQ
uniref:Ribosomal L1 domain-containing protein 1 n=1 Tax=Ciona savignyi TaxID=51511 RepID=H2ZR76_CIOSA